MLSNRFPVISLCILFCLPFNSLAETLRIAVASNFKTTMSKLTTQFEQQTGHKILLSFGSTGKHYAQILHGAPYDIFFAADAERPALLEKQQRAHAGSRFTYALGKLVLWSPDQNLFTDEKVLSSNKFHKLAIANPRLAPYGVAAKQVLQSRKQWQHLQGKLVRGENIAQTYQFVQTGNAQLGFIAYSQVIDKVKGSFWLVPTSLYSPIEQQAVLLTDNTAAKSFIHFIKSKQTLRLIQESGYDIP